MPTTIPEFADVKVRAEAGELLSGPDLMALLGISKTQYYRLHDKGDLERFKVRPALGVRPYSGTLVLKYLQGEELPPRWDVAPRRRRAS